MSKPVELYKDNASGRCSADVYRNGERLTDLRTLIDFDKLKARWGLRSEQNYADEKVTALQRLARYKECNDGFDLDCCKTSAKYYHFQPVQDMYEVLWPEEDFPRSILDSAETLVSPEKALLRCTYIKGGSAIAWRELESGANGFQDNKKLNRFANAAATIGNFMPVPSGPVPSGHQSFLRYSEERYDQVLDKIKRHYCDSSQDKDKFFCAKKNLCWLDCFVGWSEFVDKNYLKGSFVDDDCQIVAFDNTFDQLSGMLENRSRVMLEEYEKRLEGSQRSATA